MKKLMMAVGAAMFAGATLAASSFAYQGMLRDEHGAVKQGLTEAIINFRLYLSPTENEVKWGRCVTVSLATNGLFNVELSDSTGTALVEANLDDVIATAAKQGFPLYLGLEVKNSAGEIRPRQKLTPAPLAAFAQNVAEARGDFTIAGDAIVSGNLTLSDSAKSLTVKGKAQINELTVSSSSTFEDTATFKKGITGTSTASFDIVNATTVKQGNNVLIPRGIVVMWYGKANEIPDGWALCDGTDGTPNLSGRFVVGYDSNHTDYNEQGKTGGNAMCTLSEENLPPHRHQYLSAGHAYTLHKQDMWTGDFRPSDFADLFTCGSGTLSCVIPTLGFIGSYGTTDLWEVLSTGAGNASATAYENRPPYYVLAYIMKQ